MKYNIELIRLFAVVLITFTHIRHDFSSGLPYVILEEIPRFGTLILSVVSGYLFAKTTFFKRNNLLKKKTKSLLIPYLIANLAVLIPVLIANAFGYNFLNRLHFDYTIITEGLLSLSSPPIDPPTFFIRDLFIIFVLIELVLNRNYYMFLIIVPLAVFGHLLIRYDILILFAAGALYGGFGSKLKKIYLILGFFAAAFVLYYFNETHYIKHLLTLAFFITVIDRNIKFYEVGGFSYLLHLYHSPAIVATYPLIDAKIESVLLKVVAQIAVAVAFASLLYLITRKIPKLRVITGGR